MKKAEIVLYQKLMKKELEVTCGAVKVIVMDTLEIIV